MDFTLNIIEKMSDATFKSEDDRKKVFCQMLCDYIGENTTIEPLSIKSKTRRISKTDGSITVKHKLLGLDLLVCNVEGKLENGEGSCFIRNVGYYVKFWSRNDYSNIRSASNCPTFLIEIVGPSFCVSGGVLAERFTVSPLTTTFHLFYSPYETERMIKIARVLKSLKIGILDLKRYYINLNVTQNPQISFPYVHTYGPNKIPFNYIERLGQGRLLFIAKSDVDKLVIKFT